MKTKTSKNTKGLPSRPEQLITETTPAPAPVQTPAAPVAPQPPAAPARRETSESAPPINFARRRVNRELSTEQVLALLQKEAPSFFALAEVVGKWVWIQFQDKQPREVTGQLAELGFHWNNKRQVWQHPCGALTEGTQKDPRQKYPTYFPADTRAA